MNGSGVDREMWNRCRFLRGDQGGHGGHKTCLNTKLAACQLTLERPGAPPHTFSTAHRAAFEILTDNRDHGVPVVV